MRFVQDIVASPSAADCGDAGMELTLDIADLEHLERVIRSIAGIEGVVHVERKFNVRHATG